MSTSNSIETALKPAVNTNNNSVEEKTPVPTQPVRQKPKVNYEEIYNNATPFLQWPEVVEHLHKYSKTIASSFTDTNAYESGNYLLIDSKTTLPFELLKFSTQRDTIREAILEITGKKFKLGPYKKPEKQEEQKADPLDSFVKNLEDKGINITNE